MNKMSSAEGANNRGPQVSTLHGGNHDLTVCPSGSCVWRFRGVRRVADSPGSGTASAGQPGDQRGSRDRRLANGQDPFDQELSFTAKTIRAYQDEAGQPLHIFHAMNVVARRPDRLAAHVTGDDGSHDLIYDGKSVAVSSSNRNEYVVVPATGDIPSALETVQELNPDFPLVDFFTETPDKSFLSGVTAGWQVGTNKVDGVECRHLFFFQRGGVDLELWVEKNDAAIPHRLIVTYRMVPGAPNFIAEFGNWNATVHPSQTEFTFQPPADAKKIELGQAFRAAEEQE